MVEITLFVPASLAKILFSFAPPTVNAPPPSGAGAPFPSGIRATTRAPGGSTRVLVGADCALVAVTAGPGFPAEVALTRVSVFEAKLLAQMEPPEGTTTSADES